VKFKEIENKGQFFSLHPKLMAIVCDLAWYCKDNFEVDITVTSMIRIGDKGVHGDNRGCDIRSWDFTPNQIEDIKAHFNNKYPYGDGKHLTVIFHDSGQGEHFHCQAMRDGKV
jgi:hypothetical protein